MSNRIKADAAAPVWPTPIPVGERLPEVADKVYVKPSHWMPLPPPPA